MQQLSKMLNIAQRLAQSKKVPFQSIYWKGINNTINRILNGESYILSTFYVPNEIFALFDIPILYTERTAGIGAACSLGKVDFTCRPDRGCSYQKILDAMINTSRWPKPDMIVAVDFACNDAFDYCRSFAKKNDIAFFELPIKEYKEKASVELENLYCLLKQNYPIRRPIDTVVSLTNEAVNWKKKIETICFDRPGILPGQYAMNLFPVYNDLGTENAVNCFKEFYHFLKSSDTALFQDRYPLLWLGTAPVHTALLSILEARFPVRFISEELFYFSPYVITKQDFFHDLVQRIIQSPLFTIEARLEWIGEIVDTFHIKGVIHYSQHNCEFLPPMVPGIKSMLSSKGVPFVEFKGDGVNIQYRNNIYNEEMRTLIRQIEGRSDNVT